MHVRTRLIPYVPRFSRRASVALLALACAATGCADAPDPRTVRGAIAAAAAAIEERDPARLFRLVDQRARHAMASIVTDRQEAKRLIAAQYPEEERAAALTALGDAANASSATELFALRCGEPCMTGLGAQLGAPQAEERTGDEVVVTTARGGTLHMHAGKDGHFGLVWNTPELVAERDRASRELLQIKENAAVYERRRTLEQAKP